MGWYLSQTRPTYRAAIEWIAANDSLGDSEPEEALRDYLTVALAADLFGVSCERVAKDVAALRTPEKPKTSL